MTTAQRAYVKFFVLFAALFCAAYALRLAVVPDIVAVAEGEQATWRVRWRSFSSPLKIWASADSR